MNSTRREPQGRTIDINSGHRLARRDTDTFELFQCFDIVRIFGYNHNTTFSDTHLIAILIEKFRSGFKTPDRAELKARTDAIAQSAEGG